MNSKNYSHVQLGITDNSQDVSGWFSLGRIDPPDGSRRRTTAVLRFSETWENKKGQGTYESACFHRTQMPL